MARLGQRTLLVLLISAASFWLPSAAQAASGSVTTSAASATALSGICFPHPYTVSITLSADVVTARLSVKVTGPAGEPIQSVERTVNPSAGTTQHMAYEMFLCDAGPSGTYNITSSIDLYDASYTVTTVTGTPSTFAFTDPPAPPVAPAPEPVVTDVDGVVERIRTYDGRTLKFRLSALPTPAGTFEGKPLTWTFKLDKRRAKTVMQGARDTFTYSREFRFHSGRHRVVIWKNGVREATLKIFVA